MAGAAQESGKVLEAAQDCGGEETVQAKQAGRKFRQRRRVVLVTIVTAFIVTAGILVAR